MSALTDRLYAEWLLANGSTKPSHRASSTWLRSNSEQLRADWIEEARQLAKRERAEQRARSARDRGPTAGNSVLGIAGSSKAVKLEVEI